MGIVLFDNQNRDSLYPLSANRAVADLRCGIFSFKERWEQISGEKVFVHSVSYLSALYESIPVEELLWIDASLIPDKETIAQILSLQSNTCLIEKQTILAARVTIKSSLFTPYNILDQCKKESIAGSFKILKFPWQIFQWNEEGIRNDFTLITAKRELTELPETNQYAGRENIFIEEGVSINFCVINASAGPVYIAKNALVMEGCTLRGPLAIGQSAVLKMGTRVYGGTTIGPNCTVGGELKNAVLQAFSNKAHHGYLGDAVIGQWCNLGAGTSNSNVKNTGGTVRVFNKSTNSFIAAGNKCGVIMGDYSRTAINTSINTGTVIGVCCNVFGERLTPKYIPDFNWGTKTINYYAIDKAVIHLQNWKKMKQQIFTDVEISILKYIFEQYSNRRNEAVNV